MVHDVRVLVKQSDQIERMERKLSAAMGASPRVPAATIAALEEAIALARSSAEAAEWFVPAELLGELADEYEASGRVEDALAAMREALELGWSGRPDGRCRVAEILMHMNRTAEAARIWAEVRADTPDDVWLYNAAGMEYATAGDHETALRWLSDGLVVALRQGDPDDLVEQLRDLREVSLDALGRGPDGLQDRAEAFLAGPPRPPSPVPAPEASGGTGRNEACWCGSGRKYKRCHGSPA
jgi:tetratricopeptide (TPR) repeat protein